MDFENGSLVYFYLNREVSLRNHWYNKPRIRKTEFLPQKGGDLRLVCCEVPGFYIGKRAWETERLKEFLEEQLSPEGEYWYLHPGLCQVMGYTPAIPDLFLLKKALQINSCWEHVILIGADSREDGLGEDGLFERMGRIEEEIELFAALIADYLPRVNKLTIITNQTEAYEELAQTFYRDYGLTTAYGINLGRQQIKQDKVIIMDFRAGYRVPYESMPEKAAYFDVYSEEQKEKRIRQNRRDINYLSVVGWLDTLLKNRYNT